MTRDQFKRVATDPVAWIFGTVTAFASHLVGFPFIGELWPTLAANAGTVFTFASVVGTVVLPQLGMGSLGTRLTFAAGLMFAFVLATRLFRRFTS